MLPFKHGESEYTFRNLNIISTTMHSRGLHSLQLSLVLTRGILGFIVGENVWVKFSYFKPNCKPHLIRTNLFSSQ